MSDYQSIAPNLISARTLEAQVQTAGLLAQHTADVDHMTILAHDLRNYLMPVSAQLAILHKRAQSEQRELDMHAAARGRLALNHALLLITNLLEAARTERRLFDLTMQPIDLSLAVQQAAEVFDTGDTPIIVRASANVIVSADCERVRQVLHNLVANAITHSPHGAPVTLDLTTEQRDRVMWAVLHIHNQGLGIPPLIVARLFQRFAAGPTSPGLGLGLYLARGIAEAHGGTLTAHSNDGTGACFVLALPLANSMKEHHSHE